MHSIGVLPCLLEWSQRRLVANWSELIASEARMDLHEC